MPPGQVAWINEGQPRHLLCEWHSSLLAIQVCRWLTWLRPAVQSSAFIGTKNTSRNRPIPGFLYRARPIVWKILDQIPGPVPVPEILEKYQAGTASLFFKDFLIFVSLILTRTLVVSAVYLVIFITKSYYETNINGELSWIIKIFLYHWFSLDIYLPKVA